MIYVFYTIHVVICLFLVLVVLLQQGKGADLSVFGGGGTMTAFGARGAATLLHKMTVVGFVGFIVTTLAIGVLQKRDNSSSVMTDVPVVEEPAPAAQDAQGAIEEATAALPEGDGEAIAQPESGTEAAVLPETETFDEEAAEAAKEPPDGGDKP